MAMSSFGSLASLGGLVGIAAGQGALGQSGIGQLQQQSMMGNTFRDEALSRTIFVCTSIKDKTILEELQQETDAWLKDIDL